MSVRYSRDRRTDSSEGHDCCRAHSEPAVDAEALGSLNKDVSNHKLTHLRDLTERIYAALTASSSV